MGESSSLPGVGRKKTKKSLGVFLRKQKHKRDNIKAWKRHLFQRQKGR